MKILLVSPFPQHDWRIRFLRWYHRKHTFKIFSSSNIAFDSTVWNTIDLHSKQLAEHWYKKNGIDFTIHNGISYGSLLVLPVFLMVRDELWEAYALAKFKQSFQPDRIITLSSDDKTHISIFQTLFLSLFRFACASTQNRHRVPRSSQNECEYVFVLAKKELHNSVVKPLHHVILALTELNKSVSILSFDNKTCVTLQANFPKTQAIDLSRYGHAPLCKFISLLWKSFRNTLINYDHAKISQCISFGDIQIKLDTLSAERYFLQEFPFLFLSQSALDAVLTNNMILVSAMETHPKERMAFLCAAKKSIQTILVQHGVTNETIRNQLVNTRSVASKLCVWGACAKSYFTRHGISEERLIITGSPLFDAHKQQQKNRQEILRQNHLPDKRFILYSSQNFDAFKNKALCETSLKAFSDLVKSAQGEEKEIALIITLHPARSKHTQETDIETLVSRHGLVLNQSVFIQKTISEIQNLLSISEFLITSSSTLHIESLLQMRPVIMLNLDESEDMDIVRECAAPGAKSSTELCVAMKTLLTQDGKNLYEKERERFLKIYANIPVNASQTITELLLETEPLI